MRRSPPTHSRSGSMFGPLVFSTGGHQDSSSSDREGSGLPMYGHKATGGHSLGGGLYSSGPSRRGPLRRALARLWPGKRLGALLALVLLLCYGMYRATRDSPEIAAEKQRQLARCTAMPWLPACASTTRGGYSRASRQGGATNKKRDPFAGLEYKQEGGHLFYPALESSPALNVTVPRGEERPGQPHPIHKLMRDAEESWRRKQARQSRSLKDAVAEYERRYGLPPPKGFNDWYWFAKGQNVALIDEYDSIYERIRPFLSLPASEVKRRVNKLIDDQEFWMHQQTFTIRLRNSGRTMTAEGPMRHTNGRPDETMRFLQSIRKWLPDMAIVFTGHDTPWDVVAGEAKEKHNAAAAAQKYIDPNDYENYYDNWDLDGWQVICPSNSSLRQATRFNTRSDKYMPPKQGSFITDHVTAMDLCAHPERQPIHGFHAWEGPRPGLLYPIFTFTTSSLHSDLLVPPLEQYDSPVGPDLDWDQKPLNKIVWRGTTTGADLSNPHMRKWSQRPRLCRLHKQDGRVTVPLAPEDSDGELGPIESWNLDAKTYAAKYFDFKFIGEPAQCGDVEGCREFANEFEWAPHMDLQTQNMYKYVIDVDGNGWSGRFHRLMSSNTLVLKSTVFPEWYSERIQPWLHYVPVSTDYTDLWPIMAFFAGDLRGRGAHPAEARKIAHAGRVWAERYWRYSDMQVYMFRLLLEYARLLGRDDDDPTSMDFDPSSA